MTAMNRTITILVIDDNERNIKLFTLLLGSSGYEILTARNGEDGVERAKERLPDLILMDVQMPAMDGITALGLLQADERTKNIPVVAVTSYAMKGDRERLLAFGFVDYISKPIRAKDFLSAVKATVERRYE
jgi:CheY-like chemotaxis protein